MKEIGNKIRILRYKKGWSQEILAQKIGVSIYILSQIEGGEIDLQYGLLCKTAALFEIPISSLLATGNKADTKSSDLEQINDEIKQHEKYLIELQSQYDRLKQQIDR